MPHHVHLLSDAHRDVLRHHFSRLAPDDRHLRFGTALSDTGIDLYVDSIDFVASDVFAVVDDRLRVIGAIHIAYADDTAEMGLSVLEPVRGKGIGNSLFERATVRLSNRFVRTVSMHCLRENDAIMYLARKHGMRIVVEGSEADALLLLPQASQQSVAFEWIAGRFARLDYSQKVGADAARRVLRAMIA